VRVRAPPTSPVSFFFFFFFSLLIFFPLSSHTDPKVPYYTKVNETAPLSGSKKANFIAGSIVFTQASLLDSPSRYWSLVEDALAEVALTPFQPQESSDTFYRTRLECPNRGATPDGEPFREFTINPNKSSVFVVGGAKPTEGGLRINAWFDVRIRCRYSIRVGVCAFSFLCFNVCDLRDSIVTTSFSNIVPISINITFRPGDDAAGRRAQGGAEARLWRKLSDELRHGPRRAGQPRWSSCAPARRSRTKSPARSSARSTTSSAKTFCCRRSTARPRTC
jgi:hypothetical protein